MIQRDGSSKPTTSASPTTTESRCSALDASRTTGRRPTNDSQSSEEKGLPSASVHRDRIQEPSKSRNAQRESHAHAQRESHAHPTGAWPATVPTRPHHRSGRG